MTPSDNDYYYPMRYNKDCGSLEWNYCPISMEIVRTNNDFPIYKTRLELAIKACVGEHSFLPVSAEMHWLSLPPEMQQDMMTV